MDLIFKSKNKVIVMIFLNLREQEEIEIGLLEIQVEKFVFWIYQVNLTLLLITNSINFCQKWFIASSLSFFVIFCYRFSFC